MTRPLLNLDEEEEEEAKTSSKSREGGDDDDDDDDQRDFDVAELDAALRGFGGGLLAPKYAALGRPRTPCVVTLCGLPGSGKTRLARTLRDRMNANGMSNNATAVVRFDDAEREQFFYDDDEDDRVKGVERRPKTFDPEGWKRARKACFEALRAALDDDEEKNAMVILDDTMHYKSMRREAYRYAREFRAAFIVVHVDVDEKECWLRNSRRDDDDVLKVPRETFERLKTVFDAPGKGTYDADEAFDKNYITVTPPSRDVGVSEEEHEKEYAAFAESLLEDVYNRWLTDETPRRKDELDLLKLKRERSATDRVITAANLVHDVDVQTRKLMNEFMKSSSSKSSALAQRVREARLHALNLSREETKFDARKDQIFRENGDLDEWKGDASAEKYVNVFRETLRGLENASPSSR
jgi:tRNA uridine 5-carbamoylmethylation protein Kti12